MNNFYKKGTSIFEFVIYIAMVSIILTFIINILILSSGTLKDARVSKEIRNSANTSVTRIVNEIRNSSVIDIANSSLGESQGKIILNVAGGDNLSEVQIFLDSGNIRIFKGGIDFGNLSVDSVFVDSMFFRYINNKNSDSIKVEINIKDSQTEYKKSKNFYTTVILRGSYVQ